MPMHSAVAAEDQNYICLVPGGRETDQPLHRSIGFKWLEIALGRSQAEDGGGAHFCRERVTED
jgi:hypothetical protein